MLDRDFDLTAVFPFSFVYFNSLELENTRNYFLRRAKNSDLFLPLVSAGSLWTFPANWFFEFSTGSSKESEKGTVIFTSCKELGSVSVFVTSTLPVNSCLTFKTFEDLFNFLFRSSSNSSLVLELFSFSFLWKYRAYESHCPEYDDSKKDTRKIKNYH